MKRILAPQSKVVFAIAALVFTVGLGAGVASATNPNYHTATASLDAQTACYSVTIFETGLGSSGQKSLLYSLTCDATFSVVCVNKGGNTVSGQPKSGSGTATAFTKLQVDNGNVNGTISLCPQAFDLPDPGCTGSQKEKIIAASYSECTLEDSLGTTSPTLQDLSFP